MVGSRNKNDPSDTGVAVEVVIDGTTGCGATGGLVT